MNISRLASLTLIAIAAAGMIRMASALEPQGGPPPGVFPQPDEQPVQATLITEHASIQPGGTTRVGVLFELEEGWHIYGEQPGDAGLPTKIAWTPFPGAQFGPLQWPPAYEFVEAGDIRTFGYTGALVLSSGLRLVTRETPDVLPLGAMVEWLACKEICVPGSATLELSLPVRPEAPVASTHAELFDHVHPE